MPIARDHPQFKIRGAEAQRHTVFALSKLLAGRAIEPVEAGHVAEFVHGGTALVRRPEHHDATELRDVVVTEELPDQNAAERVCDKMNRIHVASRAALVEPFTDSQRREFFDNKVAGWVVDIRPYDSPPPRVPRPFAPSSSMIGSGREEG